MKYLKKFNEQEKSIEEWLDGFGIKKYRYKIKNGLVNVKGDVNIFYNNEVLKMIPVKFGTVTGDFSCVDLQLTSLENSPVNVGGSFYCSKNKLTSLVDGPKKVGDFFDCNENLLTSLEGSPKEVYGVFNCNNNKLFSLQGGPLKVISYFSCQKNELITLDGSPEKVGGTFYCDTNPIYEVYKLFGTYERYKASLDYGYWKGLNIKRGRFKLACKDAGIDVPDSIPGYEYIDL
jgi:hypothetical protein